MADHTQGPSGPEGSRWQRGQHHYGFVLALILVSIVFELASAEADWARLVGLGLQGLALLAALRASRVSPIVLRLATAVVPSPRRQGR